MDIFDKEKTVISCFDLTGNMVRPWAEAGYLCYCVDIQHPQGETRQGNIIHVGADIPHRQHQPDHCAYDIKKK